MIAKNPTPPPPRLFSLAQRRWKDSLVGLLHILPRLGKSGGHIPHSSPFSYSVRLSFFFFFFFIFMLKPRPFVGDRGGGGGGHMGPSQGNFWRVGGRCAQTPSWSCCGGHQWLTMHSGIQDTAASVYWELRVLPYNMDLGNYLLAILSCFFCCFFFVISVFKF